MTTSQGTNNSQCFHCLCLLASKCQNTLLYISCKLVSNSRQWLYVLVFSLWLNSAETLVLSCFPSSLSSLPPSIFFTFMKWSTFLLQSAVNMDEERLIKLTPENGGLHLSGWLLWMGWEVRGKRNPLFYPKSPPTTGKQFQTKAKSSVYSSRLSGSLL